MSDKKHETPRRATDDSSNDQASNDKASHGGVSEPEEPARLIKTGQVLAESGISRQMLYRYMQMDLIIPAETTETGRNLFSDSVFKQIKLIQQLNERYTLQHIREIFARRFSEKR
ncbi:MAG: MerR family transcriptional regulator [Planctomycetota bacterium]